MVKYIPEQGDIVILNFDLQSGHEQKGRRATVIISNKIFNKYVKLAFACPITNTKRNFPFHIKYEGQNLSGYIMTEQFKSIDYNSRKIKFVEKVDKNTMDEILAIIESIVEKEN